MTEHTVPAGIGRTPLKTYLSRAFPALPGWLIRDTLKKKDVRVNGVKSDAQAVVQAGDLLTLYVDGRYLSGQLSVIYQDDDLLVCDKPAGIPVDADGQGIGADTMLSRLRSLCPAARLCHRLDTYTGGVLIAAKNDAAYAKVTSAFREHRLTKRYRCVAVGMPERAQADLTGYLLKDAGASTVRVLTHPMPGALPIETRYRLVESRNGLSLLEIELITGRTHQIRAHLSHAGIPVLGDDKYGDRSANRRFKAAQPALWCVRIELMGLTFQSQPKFSAYGF